MIDVLIVGAGPSGAIAATVLARAGVGVRLIDRASFPRDKLCGDTVNPGTLAVLSRLGLSAPVERQGAPIDGIRVTGEHGVVVDAPYPGGVSGRAMRRRDFDWALLQSAIAAGAVFEPATPARRPIVDEQGRRVAVRGVVVGPGGSEEERRARVTIAADGRHSTLAFGLGVARHPDRPRRWAIGAYFHDVSGMSSFVEMHVRRGRYIGVAALAGGLTNVCVVRPSRPGDAELGDPASVLRRELAADPMLRDRFAAAGLAQPPVVLGPLAVDAKPAAIEGLLFAGDAAGFVDPMTGDGLRFAVRGAELAAEAALDALARGWAGVHQQLARRRQREFARKWLFNRTLRWVVGTPSAVTAAALGACVAPWVVRAIVAKAGDCDLAGESRP